MGKLGALNPTHLARPSLILSGGRGLALENSEPQTLPFFPSCSLSASWEKTTKKEMWSGAKRNFGITFLHLPQCVIRNAVLGSLFHGNGGKVSFNGKSDGTNNIFHHILHFIKCFNPMDLDDPKSLPTNSPRVTETEGQIKVSHSPRIKMRAKLRAGCTNRRFRSSFPRSSQSASLRRDCDFFPSSQSQAPAV